MTTAVEAQSRSESLAADLASVIEAVQRSVVMVRGSRETSGSGVVWTEAGAIVTNYHVAPGPFAQVILADGSRIPARVTRRSTALDLALLEPEVAVPLPWNPAAVRDSADLRTGELVLAIGNPLGERNVATMGVVVTAPGAENPVRTAIVLRPGNSGGALADSSGRVVGIPNVVMPGGLALAVPTRAVQRFIAARHAAAARVRVVA
ncbi:MAG TPA: serine protease [Chloroflexota bacterium]|nr:serine protease [Chloroflexota bacterium]